MALCRYLDENGHCGYWDEHLFDRETIRCEGPGGWDDDCYVEDSRGVIWEGKWLTLYEFATHLEDSPLPDDLICEIRFVMPEDADEAKREKFEGPNKETR